MMEYFDSELVKKLTVSIGDAAKITGVPVRKIRYWEEKGYIESVNKEEKTNKKYNYFAIKRIILIQELVEEGYTLDKAAEKVRLRIQNIDEAYQQFKDVNIEDE